MLSCGAQRAADPRERRRLALTVRSVHRKGGEGASSRKAGKGERARVALTVRRLLEPVTHRQKQQDAGQHPLPKPTVVEVMLRPLRKSKPLRHQPRRARQQKNQKPAPKAAPCGCVEGCACAL